MLNVFGAILLFVGCLSVGQAKIKKMDARVWAIRSVINALELMEQELKFRMPPMGEIVRSTAQRCAAPASKFLSSCENMLEDDRGESFRVIWCRAARENLRDLTQSDLESVLMLGSVLGRYDADGQHRMIETVLKQLSQALLDAQSERKNHGKVYGVLGATAGAFLVILLL